MTEGRARDLPTLFHLGTGRAGSTLLFHRLAAHPELSLSPQQEIGYYTDDYDRVPVGVVSSSCNKRTGSRHRRHTSLGRRGGASHRKGPLGPKARVHRGSPRSRGVLLLALRTGEERRQLQPSRGRHPVNPRSFGDLCERSPSYLDRGLYFRILRDYWLTEFELEQFKIVMFKDLVSDTEKLLADVCAFLGTGPPPEAPPNVISKNGALRWPWVYGARGLVVGSDRIKQKLKQSALFRAVYGRFLLDRNSLRPEDGGTAEHFREDGERLMALLGRNEPPWMENPFPARGTPRPY